MLHLLVNYYWSNLKYFLNGKKRLAKDPKQAYKTGKWNARNANNSIFYETLKKSRESCQTFWKCTHMYRAIPSNIPGNVSRNSGKCPQA